MEVIARCKNDWKDSSHTLCSDSTIVFILLLTPTLDSIAKT